MSDVGFRPQLDDQLPVDVGIVIALKEEFTEFRKDIRTRMKPVADEATGGTWYRFEHMSLGAQGNYSCVATFVGEMGSDSTGLVTQGLISRWKPRALVMLGIAASLDDDVLIGDVVVASVVDAYLANAKTAPPDDTSSYPFLRSGEVYRCSSDILQKVRNFEFVSESAFQDWQATCAQELQQLLPEEQRQAFIADRVLHDRMQMIDGHLASGPIVGASEDFSVWLKKGDRKYLALEMEAAGLMAAVYKQADPQRTLVLRAISDRGDSQKKKLDAIGKGALRRYAMRNAVNLLWKFLDAGILPYYSAAAQLATAGISVVGVPTEKSSPQTEVSIHPSSLVQEGSYPKMTNPQRTKVFISFASADKLYLDEFQKQLAVLVRKGVVEYWDTTKLVAGTVTKAEREKALQATKVAVLLVSSDYLASDSIYKNEITPLLTAAQQEGVILKSVIIRPCLYEESEIGHLVPVNEPSKPINGLKAGERETAWTKLVLEVRDALKS